MQFFKKHCAMVVFGMLAMLALVSVTDASERATSAVFSSNGNLLSDGPITLPSDNATLAALAARTGIQLDDKLTQEAFRAADLAHQNLPTTGAQVFQCSIAELEQKLKNMTFSGPIGVGYVAGPDAMYCALVGVGVCANGNCSASRVAGVLRRPVLAVGRWRVLSGVRSWRPLAGLRGWRPLRGRCG